MSERSRYKFVIIKGKSGFYWELYSKSEMIAKASKHFSTKANCERNIRAMMKYAESARVVDE